MKSLTESLINWYRKNRRTLPWRNDRDPYRIWVSEVMLQQTTVVAVIPYYEKFMTRFPDLNCLAKAEVNEVLEYWAGLGYYSRARNLHRAAQILNLRKFPKSYEELITLPGFGPYTSRAVASLAFSQKVGVLDGNVIRVLSRVLGQPISWWTPSGRSQLQDMADEMAQLGPSEDVNQGLMELGATVCTPKNPNCLLCPWLKICQARQEDKIGRLPLAKPRRATEIWVWDLQLIAKTRSDKFAFVKNDYLPFLKGQLVPPGTIEKTNKAPKKIDVRHSITHHNILIRIQLTKYFTQPANKVSWLSPQEAMKMNPSSVLRKIFTSIPVA